MNLSERYLNVIQSHEYLSEGKLHKISDEILKMSIGTSSPHLASVALSAVIISASHSLYKKIMLGQKYCSGLSKIQKIKCIAKIHNFANTKMKDYLNSSKVKCNRTNKPEVCKEKIKKEQDRLLKKLSKEKHD